MKDARMKGSVQQVDNFCWAKFLEALTMMREAFTYFLTCPSSRVWGGSQRAKKRRIGGLLQAEFTPERN